MPLWKTIRQDHITRLGKNTLKVLLGNQNTAIGLGAGLTNSQGTGNIFIGYMAGSQETGSTSFT